MHRPITHYILAFLIVALCSSFTQAAIIANHNSANEMASISEQWFDTVRSQYNFYYGHTSHGSQVVTGIRMLENENSVTFADVNMREQSGDLGHNGSLSWVGPTRTYLDDHPECNCVLWSWCGGASDNTENGITIYLQAMTELEVDYPGVIFVYMTGHLDGSGPEGNLYQRNNQIRDYCEENDKVLFDFADIESYDPDNNYYPDASDDCAWCSQWCTQNDCPPTVGCSHSNCFNCYRKGRAFWWMMATLAGWESTSAVGETPAGPAILLPNYPNPFNPLTNIEFSLAHQMEVTLQIIDSRGKLVKELASGYYDSGKHSVPWMGRNNAGQKVASGTYFYKLVTATGVQTSKLTLLK